MKTAAFRAYLVAIALVLVVGILGHLWPQAAWRTLSAGHVLIAFAGCVGVTVLHRAGLPTTTPALRTALFAFASGIPFGIVSVLIVQANMPIAPGGPLPPFTQPLPWSVPFYLAGAAVTESLFRLLMLVVPLALIRSWRASLGRPAFVVLAVGVAAAETWIIAAEVPAELHAIIYLVPVFSLLQAVWLKLHGWLAAFLMRAGQYAIWHILFGAWIQFG